MEKFASIDLILNKSVKQGDRESLLSLFSVKDRFKHMEILKEADEGAIVKVVLRGLGETELKLGEDIENGQKKTIMTLFWFSERSKPIEMRRDAAKGEQITLDLWI